MKFLNIEKQAEILMQGLVDLKPNGKEALITLLSKAQAENRPLRVKLGIDPTSSDLHLGHMVCINKLKTFQDLGHLPVLLIGGYTAQVGDPSGRNEARTSLTKEEVNNYAQTYLDQVAKVLNLSQVELVNNLDWFEKFSMTDIVKLASKLTVNQMIAKDAFGKRLDAGQALYIHEILYPLLQAYDSVQICADIELGGTDQLFNLMIGRDMQRAYDQAPQLCMTMPLLLGLDGSKKMSKTSKNYIAINDSPTEIYGKVMSIPDTLILDYYLLAARDSIEEIENIKVALNNSSINPRDLKDQLAQKIVSIYYDFKQAQDAAQAFINQFKNKEIPDNIPEYSLSQSLSSRILEIMTETGLATSNSEAKKLIQGGGVKLDGNRIDDPLFDLKSSSGRILQVGKRKFVKLI